MEKTDDSSKYHLFNGIDEEVEDKMDQYMKAQDPRRPKADLQPCPDPVVLKIGYPVKAMLVLEDLIVLGNDRGELKLIDKYQNFTELASMVTCDDPIIHMESQVGMILVQHKDANGTIFVVTYQKNVQNDTWGMKTIGKIDTMYDGFTNFSSTLMTEYTEKFEIDHICLLTPFHEKPNHPKIWVLDQPNEKLLFEKDIEIKPNQAMAQEPGMITALAVLVMASLQGIDQPKQTDEVLEADHEVFIGYESGAVGMFKISIKTVPPKEPKKGEEADPEAPTIDIEVLIYISPQKVTAEIDTKHVLTMLPMECTNPKMASQTKDFKLGVGYNAKCVQVLDIMEWVKEGYNFMDTKLSDVTYHEKPGISCLSSCRVENKILLCQGGFDHRIRLFSAKTLKYIMQIKHHNGIINRVHIEPSTHDMSPVPESPGTPSSPSPTRHIGRKKEKVLDVSKLRRTLNKVNVYSVSEDGFMCAWTLEV